MGSITKITVFAAALAAAVSLQAQGFEVGKYAGEFLSTGGGARALAMGGAYVAMSGDASTVYWNAAGLATVKQPQVLLLHSERFARTVKYNFAAVALPWGRDAGVGIAVVRLGVDDIPRTALLNPELELGAIYVDEDGKTRVNKPYVAYNFSDAEYGFFLAYGRRAGERWRIGGAAKVVHKTFDGNTAWGLGFDFAAQFTASEHVLLGANFQDLTTTLLVWNTGRRELIVPTLKLGARFPFVLPHRAGTIAPAVDFDLRFENRRDAAQAALGRSSIDLHAGVEYLFRNRLAFRLGSDRGLLTAGTGIQLPRFAVDYAFMSHDELGQTHRISLSVSLSRAGGQQRVAD